MSKAHETNACCVYDFTIPARCATSDNIREWLNSNCKKWAFQEEIGDSGYHHFQGRFSLKNKEFLFGKKGSSGLKGRFPWKEAHLSKTSSENQRNNFYVVKEETRVAGPWTDKDKVIFVPDHLKIGPDFGGIYMPWQNQMLEMMQEKPGRYINCIVDLPGCCGKSTFCDHLDCIGKAVVLPYAKDFRDIPRMAMAEAKTGTYFFDMPRALNKDTKHLRDFYSAIEHLKAGKAFDDRYKYRKEYFQQPHVFVFTNDWPEVTVFSIDRWKFWHITGLEGNLVAVDHPSKIVTTTSVDTIAQQRQLHQNASLFDTSAVARGGCPVLQEPVHIREKEELNLYGFIPPVGGISISDLAKSSSNFVFDDLERFISRSTLNKLQGIPEQVSGISPREAMASTRI